VKLVRADALYDSLSGLNLDGRELPGTDATVLRYGFDQFEDGLKHAWRLSLAQRALVRARVGVAPTVASRAEGAFFSTFLPDSLGSTEKVRGAM